VGDIAAADPSWLDDHVPAGHDLWELSRGIDPRPVVPDREAKSIGAEDTFEEDLAGSEALLPHLHAQALRVGRRLRSAGRQAAVVQLKLKLADFTLLTRQNTLIEPTDDGQTIYRTVSSLLRREKLAGKVRLTGVAAHGLAGGGAQLSLLGGDQRAGRLNQALDRIADKFGDGKVTTADVAETPPRRH
jgi:DNA polymerase-4